jgi:hypothetical protein
MLVGMLAAPNRAVAIGAEQDFHANYPHQRLHGEWFDLPPYYVATDLGHFLADRLAAWSRSIPLSPSVEAGDE